jgi:hypothetical protein
MVGPLSSAFEREGAAVLVTGRGFSEATGTDFGWLRLSP